MKFELEEYHRGITDDQLLADLKRVALELNKTAITKFDYNERGKYHEHTYQRRFGSFSSALEKAGLGTKIIMNIPEEELYKNLEEVWTKLGRQPRGEEVKRPLSKYHCGTYENRFGTWRKALEKFIAYINQDQEEQMAENEGVQKKAEEKHEKPIRRIKREISDRLRFRILLRDGFTCRKCGRTPLKNHGVELHVDHIIPWSKGGETTPDNLETKCVKCNLGKGNAFNV